MTALDEYKLVMEYLNENPDNFSLSSTEIRRRFNQNGITDISEELMDKFLNGRVEKRFSEGSTIPDNAVSKVMEIYYDTDSNQLERIKFEHQKSMLSENIVGEVLERYLADILKDYGWVWCSGEFVKAVDFIRRNGEQWTELQIKNRNNTENSSSVTVRDGTEIMKWFRSFSKASEGRDSNTNWNDFPDDEMDSSLLCEEDFLSFMEEYLIRVKNISDSDELNKFDLFPFIVKADRLENVRIYEDIETLIQNVNSEILKEKTIEKFKRNNFSKDWKRNQPTLSDIPNLNKKRKGIRRNPPELEDINNDILAVDNILPQGQVIYLNEGVLTNQDVMKCDLCPMINQDMNNKVISLKIDDEIKFYIFTAYDIWIPKDLEYTRVEDQSSELLEVYKVTNP